MCFWLSSVKMTLLLSFANAIFVSHIWKKNLWVKSALILLRRSGFIFLSKGCKNLLTLVFMCRNNTVWSMNSVFSVFDQLCEAEYSRFCCNSRIYRYLRFLAHLASVAPYSFDLLVSVN